MAHCLAKDRHGDTCRNYGLGESRFCNFHQYMNDYTEDMLSQLVICVGCKKAYYFEEEERKTCDACRERGQKIRVAKRESVVLCEKKGCKSKRSVENVYCGKHHICMFEDETAGLNKKVCANFIRGCRAQLEIEYAYSRCEECLEKDRVKDKERRGRAKEENIIDNTTKICSTCCKKLTIDNFVGELNKPTKTCLCCRQQNKIQDEKRDKEHRNATVRNNLKPQYTSYIKGAGERNLEFHISYERYIELVKLPCHYCGIIETRGFNGIDRTNSSIGYTIENCVSCCQMCNYMKGSLSLSVFIKRVEHILTIQKRRTGKLYPECFASHKKTPFQQYYRKAINTGMEFSITKDEYNTITASICYICGKQNDETNENGVDRLDSNRGYTIDNIKSCCAECNCMKIDYGFEEMLDKFVLIHNAHKNNIEQHDDVNVRNYRFGKR